MIKENIKFDLTVEVLLSYIYEKGMTFDNIDKKYNIPHGTSKMIIDTCNIFKHCGLRFEQASRQVPLKSIYKIARISYDDVCVLLNNDEYKNIDYNYISKVVLEDQYERDIKNAFIKNACDARLKEIKDEKYRIKFEALSNKLETALNFR